MVIYRDPTEITDLLQKTLFWNLNLKHYLKRIPGDSIH